MKNLKKFNESEVLKAPTGTLQVPAQKDIHL